MVLVDNVETQLIETQHRPEEIVAYELNKPRIRLCKAVSHQVAEPGDIIEFTVRFDNVGDQKVSKIVVHDSLASRFEYIEDTQKTTPESKFSIEPNEAGSSILTWTFDKTLRPGEGGFIRFQCKVR